MTTAAQRDRQIQAAVKRRDTAQAKLDKIQAETDEHTKVVKTANARIDWLKGMPVDDETPPEDDAAEPAAADDGPEAAAEADDDDDSAAL
jgi:hypothetical protein